VAVAFGGRLRAGQGSLEPLI